VRIDDLTAEVWYPAPPGSDAGRPPVRYDLRTVMPAAEAAKIPDADNAWLTCACARHLPVDDTHGPYPVIVFLHGAASFRAQSAFLMTHWASRGFVVIAPDLPGAGLADVLGGGGGSPLGAPGLIMDVVGRAPGDSSTDDPLAFVRAQLDVAHVGVAGHSLGSILGATLVDHPEIGVRIAMAGMAQLEAGVSTLLLVGDHDQIAAADAGRAGIAEAAGPARLVVVRGAGHLAFTELCTLGADRGGALAIAAAHGIAVPAMIATLAQDGCRPTDAPFAATAPAIRAATAGVLEQRLRCDPAAAAALTALPVTYDVELVERLGRP
jgi:dienelactone hydrolase